MKKISLLIVIISSICIVISESMVLINNSLYAHKMFALSFIGLGIGAILFGIWQLKNRN